MPSVPFSLCDYASPFNVVVCAWTIVVAVWKNVGGRPGPFYHTNDVSVYRGGEGSPIAFAHAFLVLNQEGCVFHLGNVQNSSTETRR